MNAIVDTNALIDGIDLTQYEVVYVPVVILEELDHLKLNKNFDLARSAKKAIRTLRLATNVQIRWKTSCSIDLDTTIVDNKIIAFAKDVVAFDKDAILVSADNNVILKAQHLEIPCEYFESGQNCKIQNDYLGYKEVILSQYELALFYECKANKWGMNENEYLIIKNEDGEVVDQFRWTSAKGFVTLYKKSFDSIALGRFKAKDVYQECAMDSLVNSQFTLLTGPAGSAKTYSALAYIMQELQKGNIDSCKIIFAGPPLKNAKEWGFLPGSLNEKMLGGSLGGILSSKLGSMLAVEQMISQGKLVLIPSSEIRGIEIGENDCLFITEAQNMDIYGLKTSIQRVKDGCKVIVEGDIEDQIDAKYCDGNANGMLRAISVFTGNKEFSCVRLKNIYRGKLANIAQEM